MNSIRTAFLERALRNLCCVAALTAASSSFGTVVWELNPTAANAPVGSSTFTVPSQGSPTYFITASGYDNAGGAGIPHSLFFKNAGGDEIGLGLTNTLDNELQISGSTASNYIQLDLTSILLQGFTNGKIKVGSVQSGESFSLWGSNTQGSLGTQLGGIFTSAFDDQFVAVPEFGAFKFISVTAASKDVLPVAFEADIAAVPEANALGPIVGLLVSILAVHILHRRKSIAAECAL